jgi:hypothetical protein
METLCKWQETLGLSLGRFPLKPIEREMEMHKASQTMFLKEAGLLGATQPVRMLCMFSSSPWPHHRPALLAQHSSRTAGSIYKEYFTSARLTGESLKVSQCTCCLENLAHALCLPKHASIM